LKAEHFTIKNKEGQPLFVYKWLPEKVEARGIVQIAHGMAEHAGRYERFADLLTSHGYIVYANDHRGHGRTAGDLKNVGYLGRDGFSGMVLDMKYLSEHIRGENLDLPLILFGHSMGSFLAQAYIQKWGQDLDGLILSGSNGQRGLDLKLGIIIARIQNFLLGEKRPSRLLNRLSFGAYNASFKPVRTPFDWLSTDTKEVDKYIKDPYCGGVFTTSFFLDFFLFLDQLYDREQASKIAKDLPIYIISGAMDPVGEEGKGVQRLIDFYKELGLRCVSSRLYLGARHELVNEVNRDEVMSDILNWLDSIGQT
jgi:alpha-beta hydrolase superfamily lysophospholipase